MELPKKIAEFTLVALTSTMIGYGTGVVLTERKNLVTLEHSITLKWSDGVFDDPPLGAHVFLEPHMNGKSVRLRVYIGRIQPQFFMLGDIGEIDVVDSAEAAAEKWAQIQWRRDGLYLGVDGNRTRLIVPRKDIKPYMQ